MRSCDFFLRSSLLFVSYVADSSAGARKADMSDQEPIPLLTPGIEPTSGESHSPPTSFFPDRSEDMSKMEDLTKDLKGANVSNADWNDAEANLLPEKVQELASNGELPKDTKRKRIVVVGLGMVGISFM